MCKLSLPALVFKFISLDEILAVILIELLRFPLFKKRRIMHIVVISMFSQVPGTRSLFTFLTGEEIGTVELLHHGTGDTFGTFCTMHVCGCTILG